MNTIELFSGTQSFSKVARELGHETFCVDNNPEFDNDLTFDLCNGFPKELVDKFKEADIIWMSPMCSALSIASGNKHWTIDRQPKTENAKIGLNLLNICKQIRGVCIMFNKKYIIENPRARARWFLPISDRQTAWYCQYGDKRAKPTDIWTNVPIKFRFCHNGNPDHEPVPRGSKTGTQGMKKIDRYKIPQQLCEEIIDSC